MNEKKTPRRDATGHLDPQYAKDLLARSRENANKDDDRAFIGTSTTDDLAENLGEQFVANATSGEPEGEDVLDQVVEEERGGPFVITTSREELASGTDASNPRGATREPFPKT